MDLIIENLPNGMINVPACELINLGLTEDVAMTLILEAKMKELRLERDKKLQQSDKTQLPDSPMSEEIKAQWKIYRQQLRDLPQTTDNPDAVIWPKEPVQ